MLPSAVSSDVQWIMNNMLRLQHMGPEEAAKILKDIAALQGPYMRIEEQRALCTSRKTLGGIMLYAVIQKSTLTMDLARPGSHATVERGCAQSARSLCLLRTTFGV